MWQKAYKDYKQDEPLIKERVETGKGLIGCEMHELNGWGETWHVSRKKKKTGFWRSLFNKFTKS